MGFKKAWRGAGKQIKPRGSFVKAALFYWLWMFMISIL
jgi:hypothetical protein